MCYKVTEWMADSTLPFSHITIFFRLLQVKLEFFYIQVSPAAFNGGGTFK